MKIKNNIFFVFLFLISCNSTSSPKKNIEKETILKTEKKIEKETILKIEMNLSAFGVESDHIPSIRAYIDFEKKSSNCEKSFYHPSYKGGTYSLTKEEMSAIWQLLKISDLEKLQKEYRVNSTDQPTSTTIIYTTKNKFVIEDYGLRGEFPLRELYKIVYKY